MTIHNGSTWRAIKPGQKERTLIIDGIYGQGAENRWHPVSYEFLDKATGEKIELSQVKVLELIANGNLVRQ